jgi:hypothetical protein
MFRADSFNSALLFYKKIFLLDSGYNITELFTLDVDLIISVLCIILLITYDYFAEIKNRIKLWNINAHPVFMKYYIIVLFFLIIFFFGKFNQIDFLYFKF